MSRRFPCCVPGCRVCQPRKDWGVAGRSLDPDLQRKNWSRAPRTLDPDLQQASVRLRRFMEEERARREDDPTVN